MGGRAKKTKPQTMVALFTFLPGQAKVEKSRRMFLVGLLFVNKEGKEKVMGLGKYFILHCSHFCHPHHLCIQLSYQRAINGVKATSSSVYFPFTSSNFHLNYVHP